MKDLIAVFSCDVHHSNDSKELIGIFTNKDKAILALKPLIKIDAKQNFDDQGYDTFSEMVNDCIGDLERINQTQSLDTNYMLESATLNQLSI